ncbi:MAG: hypothetical protein QOG87_1150 [Actinomycetota bacterium]|jgi:hypothetical protein
MRRRLIFLAAGVAAAGGLLMAPQANAGLVCVNVHIDLNGQAVDQSPCVDTPDLGPTPTLPALPLP